MTAQIITNPNPDTRKNWIFTIENMEPDHIQLRIIPDKLVADHSSIRNYLNSHLLENFSSPEEMLVKIIEDVNNALVPIWVEVTYRSDGIIVKVEDKQPG